MITLGVFLGGFVAGAYGACWFLRRYLLQTLDDIGRELAEEAGGEPPASDELNTVRARLLGHNIERGITCRVYSPCGDRWQAEAVRHYGYRRNGDEITAVLACEWGSTQLEAASKLAARLDEMPVPTADEGGGA